MTGQRMSGKRKNNISRYIYIIYKSALQNTHAVWIVTGDTDWRDCEGLMLFTGQCAATGMSCNQPDSDPREDI